MITNPPFSLFREFVVWLASANKTFSMIGTRNAITYRDIFPLIRDNQMWLGRGFQAGNAFFGVPDRGSYADGVYDDETGLVKFRNCCWFTNIDHGLRHEPLQLMTTADNIKFSRHKDVVGSDYTKYDNFDAIEVPYTDAIPSDHAGVMGVPITFLDKYNPDQFEIVELSRYTRTEGMSKEFVDAYYASGQTGQISEGHPDLCYYDSNGRPVVPYMRVLIRRRVGS